MATLYCYDFDGKNLKEATVEVKETEKQYKAEDTIPFLYKGKCLSPNWAYRTDTVGRMSLPNQPGKQLSKPLRTVQRLDLQGQKQTPTNTGRR